MHKGEWSRKGWKVAWLTACLLMTSTTRAALPASNAPISLGFFPIISTVALYKRFAPLRDYLAQQLNRPVNLETAKDFPTFLRRTDKREYDIVVTAPHFAVRAADSGKYRIRAALLGKVYQLLVVRKDSPIRAVDQLAGRPIATPPNDALMTMIGKRLLASDGLTGKRSPVFRAYVSHNAANQALLGGEVDAAIASSNVIKKAMGKGVRFRILKRSFQLPNMATLIATDVDPALAKRIVNILVNMKKTAEGRAVLKKIRFPGYRRVKSAAEYESVRPYMEQATRKLALP